jgi:hypothetical protein
VHHKHRSVCRYSYSNYIKLVSCTAVAAKYMLTSVKPMYDGNMTDTIKRMHDFRSTTATARKRFASTASVNITR